MKLTPKERTRILGGSYRPLHRDDKPDIEPRAEIVVSWTHPRAFTDDELQHVFRPEPEPAMWITVTKIVRRTKGGWAVYFDVTDTRHPDWYLSRAGYTRSKRYAIDELSAPVDTKTHARLSAEARQLGVDRRAETQEIKEREMRKQERAVRDRLREAMHGLAPVAQAALLAALEREIIRARNTEKAA